MLPILLKHRFLRFCLVGGLNTAVDIGIYLLLRAAGVDIIIAIIISTGIGLAIGYKLHTSFTFRTNRARFLRFLAVSLVGLWVIQPIIAISSERLVFSYVISGILLWFCAKLAATLGSLAWNYSLYKRFVYR